MATWKADSRARRWSFACVCLTALGLLITGCAHGRPETPASTPDAITDGAARPHAPLEHGPAPIESAGREKARGAPDRSADLHLASQHTVEAIRDREIEALNEDGEGEEDQAPPSLEALTALPVDDTRASPQMRQRAVDAVAEESNDLQIELNDAVLGCIALYQGPLRDWFGAALARGGRYLPTMRAVLASEGLPQDLVYMALVESAFKPRALSRARARGVWQFIPSTGRRFGLRQTSWLDERSDPEKATRAAARYLRELYDLFGNWDLAMASYNAGENAVLRAVQRHHTQDFWTLRRTRSLRRETRNYVPMIHAAIVVAKAPEKYGFDVEAEPVLQFEHVPLQGPVNLHTIAACADTSVARLRDLNPALRRLTTPPRERFDVKVPPGSGTDVLDCMSGLPTGGALTTHTVARGDTLSSMSRRYGVSARDIADANGMSIRTTLHVGTRLLIPTRDRLRFPALASQDEPTGDRDQGRRSGRSADVRRASSSRSTTVRHRIRPGDTLEAIARRYGTTVEALRRWNGLPDSRIAAGQDLLIFPARRGQF
jgi:membrane-bound lytic murein transglycosylase D